MRYLRVSIFFLVLVVALSGCSHNLSQETLAMVNSLSVEDASVILAQNMAPGEQAKGLAQNVYGLKAPLLDSVDQGIISYTRDKKENCTAETALTDMDSIAGVKKCYILREKLRYDVRNVEQVMINKSQEFSFCGSIVSGECITLVAIIDGEKQRLSINIPSQSLNSLLAAIKYFSPAVKIKNAF